MRRIAVACSIGVLCTPWLGGCRPAPVDPALSACFAADNAVGDQLLKLNRAVLAIEEVQGNLGTTPGPFHDALLQEIAKCSPVLPALPVQSWNPLRAQAAKDCKLALGKEVEFDQKLVDGLADTAMIDKSADNVPKITDCEEGGFLIGRLQAN